MGAAASIYYDGSMASVPAPMDLPGEIAPLPPAPPLPVIRSAGDEARLRAMLDANFDFVWRALRGLGVPTSAADDAAQHVFLVASQKLAVIDVGSERAFLAATARGVAANFRRSGAHTHEVPDEEVLMRQVDVAPDPEERAAKGQALQALERLLQGLDEDLRVVFVFFELEGMTTAEISVVLGVPMGTVASRLRRAREEFQAAVKRLHASGGGRR